MILAVEACIDSRRKYSIIECAFESALSAVRCCDGWLLAWTTPALRGSGLAEACGPASMERLFNELERLFALLFILDIGGMGVVGMGIHIKQ
jgi:hypothetical protein